MIIYHKSNTIGIRKPFTREILNSTSKSVAAKQSSFFPHIYSCRKACLCFSRA